MSTTPTIRNIVIAFIWAAINNGHYIFPRFRAVLSSIAVMEDIFDRMGWVFVPDLLAVITASKPPKLELFKRLSSKRPSDAWGIYNTIMEKLAALREPFLYTGSATNKTKGVRSRMLNYESRTQLPTKIVEMLMAGYKITSVKLLAHCPLPGPADVPQFRTFTIAMEACFSCIFWTMWSRKSSYGYSELCPWPKDSFRWRGLCTHSALKEGFVWDGLGLTNEELERIGAEQAAHHRQYMADRRASDPEEMRAQARVHDANRRPDRRLLEIDAIQSGTYRCEICDVSCRSPYALDDHNQTDRHLRWVKTGGRPQFECEPCGNVTFASQTQWNEHIATKKHIGNASGVPKPDTKCHICDIKFPGLAKYNTHLASKGHIRKAAAVANSN